jgi:hypothetical protein
MKNHVKCPTTVAQRGEIWLPWYALKTAYLMRSTLHFDIQYINIRFSDNVLILSDYLCWLSGEGDLGMSFGADSGKSSTLTKN